MDWRSLKKNAVMIAAIPGIADLGMMGAHFFDKGERISPGVKKIINRVGVGCVNAGWIIVPLTRQPRLREPWARAAKALGLPLMVGGAVIGHLSTRDRGIIGVETPDSLLTEGMYGRMRHPTYAALLAASLGWSLFRGAPYSTAALPLLAAGLLAGGMFEERAQLEPIFGEEYEAYKEGTPFFPLSLTMIFTIMYLLALCCLNERFLDKDLDRSD